MRSSLSSLASLDDLFAPSLCLAALTLTLAACSSANDEVASGTGNGPWTSGAKIPPETQEIRPTTRKEVIGTDAAVANMGVVHAPKFVD